MCARAGRSWVTYSVREMLCYWHFSERSFLLALSRSKWRILCNWRCSPGQKRIPSEGSQQNIILICSVPGVCHVAGSWDHGMILRLFGWLGAAPLAMQVSELPPAVEMHPYLPYWVDEYYTSCEQNVLVEIWLTNNGEDPCPCQAILLLPSDFRFSDFPTQMVSILHWRLPGTSPISRWHVVLENCGLGARMRSRVG